MIFLLALFCLMHLAHVKAQEKKDKQEFPYELKLKRDLMIGGVSFASILIPVTLPGDKSGPDKDIVLTTTPDEINIIDRFATNYYNPKLNDIREDYELVINAAGVGSFVTYALLGEQKDQRFSNMMTLGAIYLEGTLLAHGIMYSAKTYIDRRRPYTYNTDLPIHQRTSTNANMSFISGNATTVFYNSVFISKVFSDLYPNSKFKNYIWAGTMGLAVTSGAFSVFCGKHYPTDVMAGALVGGLCGYLIPEIHKKSNGNLAVIPFINNYSKGVSVSYTF